MTTPGPFTARPLEDGVWIVVGRDDDEGDTHTVCRAEPCVYHAGRAEADAQAIAAALNAVRRAFFGPEPTGTTDETP